MGITRKRRKSDEFLMRVYEIFFLLLVQGRMSPCGEAMISMGHWEGDRGTHGWLMMIGSESS